MRKQTNSIKFFQQNIQYNFTSRQNVRGIYILQKQNRTNINQNKLFGLNIINRHDFCSKQQLEFSDGQGSIFIKKWYHKVIPQSKFEFLLVGLSLSISSYFLYQWWVVKDEIAIKNALKNNDYTLAATLLEKKVLNKNKFYLKDAAQLYMCYLEQLQYKKAEDLLLRMIEVLPDDQIATRFQLSNLYISQEKFGLAIEQLSDLIKINPEVKLEQRNFVEKTIKPKYQKYFNEQNTNYSEGEKGYLLGCIGLLYFYLQQYKDAEVFQRKSLQYYPDQQSILCQLGITLYIQDKLEESQNILEKISSSKTANEQIKKEAISTLIGIYHIKNENKKALQLCQKQDTALKQQCMQIIDNLKDQPINSQKQQ